MPLIPILSNDSENKFKESIQVTRIEEDLKKKNLIYL